MMNRFHSLLYKYATSQTMADLSNRYPVNAEDIKTVRDLYNAVWVMFRGNMAKMIEAAAAYLIIMLVGGSFLWMTYFAVIYPFVEITGISGHVLAWTYYILLARYLVYRFENVERWYNRTIGSVIKYGRTAIVTMFGRKITQKIGQKITDKLNQELDVDTKDPE